MIEWSNLCSSIISLRNFSAESNTNLYFLSLSILLIYHVFVYLFVCHISYLYVLFICPHAYSLSKPAFLWGLKMQSGSKIFLVSSKSLITSGEYIIGR